ALVPIYNTSIYHYGFKSVFTIHNIAYQGQYDLAIRGDLFGLPPEAGAFVEYDGCINLMKGAIECSNIVTTVSPTYAAELKNPYYAEGLEDIIKRNDFKMRGILNGISFQAYNPEDDENLAATYSVKDLSGKAEDKQRLQELCNLPVNPDVPVLAIISRLVYHKGIQLLQIAADSIVNDDVQLVILGVGDKAYENYFQWLASQYPAKVSANITFSGAMSHRIYAGADILLMPSLTEPCGLAQMIACRYGTVPIVRETGGLRDSVKDCSTGEGNGFTFAGTDPAELSDAVKRAVELYRSKDEWKALVEHIMGLDFSWDKSSGDYEDVYRELVDF
nr:glycogen/starch synthase [Eubacterium sp.]